MTRWKIFYGDGSTFSCEDGTPARAPCLNVQVIIQDDPRVVWKPIVGADYYVFEALDDKEAQWRGVDLFGLWEYLFSYPGYKIAKAGKTLHQIDYNEIWRNAVNDPKFGRKATFAKNELRPSDEES